MLKVSNSIPISNYSQIVISDNAGATFKPKTNSRVRINLPSTLGMIDFHSSYIQLNTKTIANATQGTTNTYKMGWGNRQGVNQIIRDLIIRVDGRALETITNYNVLDKAHRDYANDLTLNNLDSTWSHATLQPDNPSYSTTAWDTTTAGAAVFTYNNISTKNQLQLDLSGLLSLKTGFPIVAAGNVEIEFILEDAENCLVPLHNMGAVDLANQTAAASGALDTLTLANNVEAAGAIEGFSNTDNPYAEGNVMKYVGTDAADAVQTRYFRLITQTVVTTTKLVLTSTDLGAGFLAANAVMTKQTVTPMFNTTWVDKDTAPTAITSSQWNYEVSNVEFVARAIEMPPPYVSALQKRIQGEGMVLDVPTYSMYLSNIQSNLIKQSLLVPCYGTRVKGVVSVPVNSVQTPYRFDRNGKVDGLREYQAKIGSRVEPQRPVDLSNWTLDTTHQYHAQEHIQELTKTLNAVGIGERSLTRWRDNFLITRRLGAMGGSEDLTEKGFRWEIQYNTNTNSAKNAYNFVSMVRRIQILPTGVNIFG
tara:strand:- start:260 stop:1864 length:1605 start_codon:yes stop_codon:yes gene_type:complete